jgi:curved DNA-binding protein CbpA
MITGTIPMVRCPAFGRNKTHCNCKVLVVAAGTTTSSTRSSLCSERRSADYYKVLSLEHQADVGAEDIKRAYRRLALRCHPDVCPPSRRAESTELFLELRRAYETLSDPVRKVRYDASVTASGGREPSARPGVDFASRDVWESQLSVLRARSEQRHRTTRSGRSRRSDRPYP